jgi:hypothetical protein
MSGVGQDAMIVGTNRTPYSRVVLLFALAAVCGCGDDDEGSSRRGEAAADAAPSGGTDAGSAGAGGSSTTRARTVVTKLADGIVGKACAQASDCGAGSCMQTIQVVNTPYPGGYCSGSCYSDGDCGAEGVCQPGILGRVGSCYLRCDVERGCPREGYRCRVVADVARCIAAPEPLADNIAGAACTSDADCGGVAMSCTSMIGAYPAPGGYCSESCAVSEDCGAGGVCINGISIVTISSGKCMKSCSTTADCREGYVCTPFGGPSSDGPGACTPIFEDSDAGVPEL